MSSDQVVEIEYDLNPKTGNIKAGKPCSTCFDLKRNAKVKGYTLEGAGRACVLMSNIFLSTSLIWLASEAADCVEDNTIVDDCGKKVYGFLPSSLITNIAVVSGVASAFFMPLIGAIVDYTEYRRSLGISSAIGIIAIQFIQVYTVSSTWFAMAILQAIGAFIYEVQVLSTYAYLPEIARELGESVMTTIASNFMAIQFGSECVFLIVIITISRVQETTTVVTAQISQAICVILALLLWTMSWKSLPSIGKNHEIPEGSNLVTVGFYQNYKTMKMIKKHYSRGLLWFYLAVAFAEAGANSFTTVSVTYLASELNMNGAQIGMVFLGSLISTLPGTAVASFVTKRTDPNTSWKLCMAYFAFTTIVGAFILTDESRTNYAYILSVFWGIALGWFYPTENLFFSMCLPKGQEAELSGFLVYCSTIISWLPPLIFTLLNEAGIHMKYGLISLTAFFFAAIILLSMAAPWPEIVEEAQKTIEENDE
mmetsp:Transcript_15205/g.18515  ORF Transcript_15205/g.18515 Transcript_15205/m.18515 type:complete len:481 (-) Transcript_15205:209-1651(-)|eukprot:CAMPEP_0194385528 /NCGR_PEP_ID=MMETSP0174-20130528/80738_1 /TAXON_ID=216777 /ORGANISM="Proboscia alata, Strain PI-D3" /LENGTH=480 /DNA_ID=CAMNT_0039173749 /DNA_START=51 /DNA_END=1493 /DNA_ORIENTATION=+